MLCHDCPSQRSPVALCDDAARENTFKNASRSARSANTLLSNPHHASCIMAPADSNGCFYCLRKLPRVRAATADGHTLTRPCADWRGFESTISISLLDLCLWFVRIYPPTWTRPSFAKDGYLKKEGKRCRVRSSSLAIADSMIHPLCRLRASIFRPAPVRRIVLFIRSETPCSRSNIPTSCRALHRRGAQRYPSRFEYRHLSHQMSELGGLQ